MKIGLDAKRAFHNTTGLGNYSRTLIEGITTYYSEHEYFLFNPKPSRHYRPLFSNIVEINPSGIFEKNLSSLWRSSWIKNDLQKLGIELYHGLSNEIPVGINQIKIPSVVTIHDLIFERYPHQFAAIDRKIYRKKFMYACQYSNRIIAISKQTKQDIIDLYKIDELKIDICYQSCDPSFEKRIDDEQKEIIRQKFFLPEEYFLYIGSIVERKNLMNICKALLELKEKINIPLVVIGNGKTYKQKVKEYISKNKIENRVIFLSEKNGIEKNFLHNTNILAAIYQMAILLVYPSFFEGFGIPVLEALWSKIPVITSNTSCLPETGGDASFYVDPQSSEEIAKAMLEIYSNQQLRKKMIELGWQHAQNFTLQKCTDSIMKVYKKIV